MGRLQSVTDQEILQAARKVIAKRGPDAFTLSEVAGEVGLSRAAIILRFKSTQALKVTIVRQQVGQFLDAIEKVQGKPGGDGLLEVAAFLGAYVGSRKGSAAFFRSYSSNVQDRELVKLESERGGALRAVISRVMPKVAIEHEAAVDAFNTHIAGSIIIWLGSNDRDAHAFLVRRTKEWLRLVGIPYSEGADDRLANARSKAKAARKALAAQEPRTKAAPRSRRPSR
jgi:TetR/AcrR family macrolide resistance operon transcriptional repressor